MNDRPKDPAKVRGGEMSARRRWGAHERGSFGSRVITLSQYTQEQGEALIALARDFRAKNKAMSEQSE